MACCRAVAPLGNNINKADAHACGKLFLKILNTSLLLSLTFTLKIVKSVIFPLQTLDKRMKVL
jgi:hypothetical protein